MKLPSVLYADGIKKGQQVKFGGLNHNLGADDGELWDMRNLTSDYFPLLATRAPRRLYRTLESAGGLYCWEKLCWVDGTGFYYDGERKGAVTAGQKTFAALGAYIVIFPDKAWYNTLTGEFGSLEDLERQQPHLHQRQTVRGGGGGELHPGQRRQLGGLLQSRGRRDH